MTLNLQGLSLPAGLIPGLVAAALLALPAGPAAAQEAAAPAPSPPAATPDISPFDFAARGDKARALAAEAEAEGEGRVIGGTVSAPGAWPWQVALVVADMPVSPDSQFCGGSLVLDNWVLTAAHCVHMEDDRGRYRNVPVQKIAVLAGTNVLAPGQGDVIPVEAIFVHPDYVGSEFDNDVALIKLARAPQGVRWQAITVPTADYGELLDQPGVPTFVTGWGLVNGGGHPDRMREAQIQVLSREQCNGAIMEARADEASGGFAYAVTVLGLSSDDASKAWAELNALAPRPLSENMICSGTFEGGKTACQGDSGGPLVVPLKDGSYIQAGIVSWGLSSEATQTCAEDVPFSAYTKISKFVGWLDQTINAN